MLAHWRKGCHGAGSQVRLALAANREDGRTRRMRRRETNAATAEKRRERSLPNQADKNFQNSLKLTWTSTKRILFGAERGLTVCLWGLQFTLL
jgi:hypothetical protein